jgi:hypothetical protein
MNSLQLIPPSDIHTAFAANSGIQKKGESSVRSPLIRTDHSPSMGDETIVVNGVTYRHINMTNILYNVNNNKVSQPGLSLVDRGANGGVLGSDVLILETTSRSVNIVGIDNHEITNIPICTGAGYTRSQHGPIIVTMHQYAYLGNGKTIHSSIQMEHYKLQVNDRAFACFWW